MPTDPEISLGVAAPPAPVNPLGVLGQFAQIQGQLNQNQLFQKTMIARTKAGQILAAAPDLETGLTRISQDPDTSPYAGEIVNTYRQAMLANAQQQGEYQKQAIDGWGALQNAFKQGLADPSQLVSAVQAQLKLLSPEAQKRDGDAVQSVLSGLVSGMPTDPDPKVQTAKQTAYLQKNLAGMVGASPDLLTALLGAKTSQSIGGTTVFGIQKPQWEGGGFAPSNQAPNTLAPAITTGPGGVPIPVGGGAAPGIPNALGATSPAAVLANPSAKQPIAAIGNAVDQELHNTGGPIPGSVQAGVDSAPQIKPQGAPQIAGDGKPLLAPQMESPYVSTGLGGMKVLSPAQQDQAKQLQDEYSTTGLKEYNNATTSLASLRYMDNALDTLAKGGGFLVPGTLANARADLGKAANTIAQMTGNKPAFDPSKIASVEDFNKETKRMGLQVINQMLGGQREAAQIITGVTQSVPGVDNTYLGGKLVSAGLQAAAQRVIDLRNFQNSWQAQNQGNLAGANEAFNNAHPAEEYAKAVLDKMGMTESGFKSPQAVQQAYRSGYITRDQAAAALHLQFPSQFHAPAQGTP